jgi:hypothetical protein
MHVGLGRIKPILEPTLVDSFPIDEIERDRRRAEKMSKKNNPFAQSAEISDENR